MVSVIDPMSLSLCQKAHAAKPKPGFTCGATGPPSLHVGTWSTEAPNRILGQSMWCHGERAYLSIFSSRLPRSYLTSFCGHLCFDAGFSDGLALSRPYQVKPARAVRTPRLLRAAFLWPVPAIQAVSDAPEAELGLDGGMQIMIRVCEPETLAITSAPGTGRNASPDAC